MVKVMCDTCMKIYEKQIMRKALVFCNKCGAKARAEPNEGPSEDYDYILIGCCG